VPELNVKLLPDLGPKSPVAAVENKGKQVVSDDSSATVTAVAIAAVPLVFWLPAELTPGRSILAEPLKLTPPILRAVANVVAVAAFPVQLPELPEVLPVTLPVRFPSNVATNVPVA
jgi:hypothetical protein